MIFRSIQWLAVFVLFLSRLLNGEAAGKELGYSGHDLIAPPQFENHAAAPLRVSRRPKLARIPNLNIYYATDLRYNLYMADKRWYLLHNEKWYQAQTHEGPWRYLNYSKVPESLKKIPNEFIKKGDTPLPLKKKPPKPTKKKPVPKKSSPKSAKKG